MITANIKAMRTIPAQPGFFVIEVLCEDDGRPVATDSRAVIAWAMEDSLLIPYPVTLYGVQTEACFILQPDGTVERPNIDWFQHVGDWMKDQCEKYENQRDDAK